MKTLSLALAMFFLTTAHALENLDSCESSLTSTFPVTGREFVHLTGDQILLRGKLYAHWETGMEDQTGWSIEDHQTYTRVSPTLLSVFVLREGDEVFIFDEKGSIRAHGYYAETSEERVVKMGPHEIASRPNLPMLYADRELTVPLMGPQEFIPCFGRENKAVAIQTLTPEEKQRIRHQLEPWLARYRAHMNNPERFVTIGDLKYELAHFEHVYMGALDLKHLHRPVRRYVLGLDRVESGFTEPGLDGWVRSKAGDFEVKWGDRLLLLDENGHVYFDQVIYGDLIQHKAELEAAHSAAVIKVFPR